MVTPYPPLRDGIASYAVQTVARLRAEGHDVEVLSPGPSAAHHHLSLKGPRGALALAKRVRNYDKVIVQFHPEVFFRAGSGPGEWALESVALFAAFVAARQVEVRVHEIDYTRGQGRRALQVANRLPWRAVDTVVVHTEVERESISEAYGIPIERIRVTKHGGDFRRATAIDKLEARKSLGLPNDEFCFLNIGFIQPHKGFDRSVRVMADIAAGPAGDCCRLDIVGSVRTPEPSYLTYLSELQALVDANPRVYLHLGYLTDEFFDRWLVASDVVVLPYRSIWSSGVMERALLYGRPVIATDVGGLSFQRAERDGVTLVQDDDGLRRAMSEALTTATGIAATEPRRDSPSWAADVVVDRERIQAEIRKRAARNRIASEPVLPGQTRDPHTDSSRFVRNVPPLVLPTPGSRLPGLGGLRKLIHRAIAWEIEPLVHQVNALREATIKALDR